MSVRSRHLVLTALAIAALGCSNADIVPRDAGGGVDAGAPRDSGSGGDAGDGVDAGGTMDAGDGTDAGDGIDAGPTDAGPPDAGPPDAGPTEEPGEGELVISELMPDSDTVTDDCGEWLELYNPSADVTYNLVGCTLHDEGNTYLFAEDVIVTPGEYVSLARYNPTDCEPLGHSDPGFSPDYTYRTVKFGNDGDTAWVECSGVTVDEVDFNAWTITKGASFNLDPDTLDATSNDDVTNWCTGTTVYNMVGSERDRGTPGAPNTNC